MHNKTIHYCWFGNNPKPPMITRCMDSWKKHFPDFEIKEWNESNFDVHCNTYVSQAYDAGKYAFVSDYARFWVLEKHGGLYFDTDVEVIRPFDKLLEQDAFAGFETAEHIAPGLVLWAKDSHFALFRETLDWYDNAAFLDENGNRIKKNVCGIFTDILKNHGFIPNNQMQTCGGLTLFPSDYFNPFDDATGIMHKTENTHAIHWYAKSWMSKRKILRSKFTRILHRLFGRNIKQRLMERRRKK